MPDRDPKTQLVPKEMNDGERMTIEYHIMSKNVVSTSLENYARGETVMIHTLMKHILLLEHTLTRTKR